MKTETAMILKSARASERQMRAIGEFDSANGMRMYADALESGMYDPMTGTCAESWMLQDCYGWDNGVTPALAAECDGVKL